MPGTTTPTLVSVDQALVVEAIALVFAASSVFSVQAGRQDHPLSDFFTQEAADLQTKLFGRPKEGDGNDPLEVEIQARAMYLTADALEASVELGLVKAYRKHSADMREAGTTEVPFDNAMAEGRDA